jgi:hypothetical protein
MMRTFNRSLGRAAGLGAVAMLALPLAAQAAGFRTQLSEQISSGAVKANPALTLHATIDDGSGNAPASTGWLRFMVDAKHLSPNAWASLMAATPGTQLGTFTSELSDSAAAPLRVLGHGNDATGPFVRAGVGVTGATAAIIGSDTLTIVIRPTTSAKHIAFVLDTRAAIGKLAAQGAASTLQDVTLSLRGAITFAGKSHALTLNPVSETALTNSALARACAQAACTTLLPSTGSGSASVHLPKSVTLAAPVTATYGYRYSIGGTGRSGDQVILQALSSDGLVPASGMATTLVRPDGTFVIRATVRSTFSDDGDLTLPARGRYAVASVEGGNATVYGMATQDTHVNLARPTFVLQRKAGSKLHFSIRVPGGDRHVRVAIKLGSKTLATGYASHSGLFAKTIVRPALTGNLRVVASVPGADTAISAATPFSR